jgi:hypothetical protein
MGYIIVNWANRDIQGLFKTTKDANEIIKKLSKKYPHEKYEIYEYLAGTQITHWGYPGEYDSHDQAIFPKNFKTHVDLKKAMREIKKGIEGGTTIYVTPND